jgi:hypothetical protein
MFDISKIYYINLDKRVDRRTFMENQLSEFDIPYERFPAVLIKRDELINKNSEYKHIYNKFLPEHNYSKITESEKQFRQYRGSIGAYISFYNLLKSLVKTKQTESVLIIQDDCVLKKGWCEIFQSFISNTDLPTDFDILRCVWGQKNRTYVKKIETNHIFSENKKTKTTALFGGAHFTLINKNSIKKAYEYLENSSVYQIDALLWTTSLNAYHAKFKGTIDYLPGHISDCDPEIEH